MIAASTARAAHILEVLRENSRFKAVWLTHEANLASYDVVVADGTFTGNLAMKGPAVVLIDGDDKIRSGFRGRTKACLPPDFTPGELTAAVEAAAHDLTVLTEVQAKQWLEGRELPDRDLPVETLTARELEVLRMLADGSGNKEIAARLGISDHTAKFHVAQILAKFRAGSRAEAVAIGIRRGLVPI